MEIKLLSQGSYGCIFKPGINCETDKPTKKYITKVQKQQHISEKETIIGKEIQKIVQYEKYFAPIINTCPINLKKINNKEITKCNFIDTNKIDKYESNQILFVGNDTLYSYINNIINTKQFLKKTLNVYISILEGLQKLYEKGGIIHLDIKENNIMISNQGKPKIIDFGLSYILKNINKTNYKDVFFVYAPEYAPWCIEIIVINYIIHKLNIEWMDKEITIEILDKIVNEYIKYNYAINELFTEKEKIIIKENYINYLKSKITTGEEMIKELMNTSKTWDTYSLNISFLYLFNLIGITHSDIIKKIQQTIKEQIICSPNDRLNSKNNIQQMKDIIKKVNIQDYNELTNITSRINIEELSNKIKKSKINENKIEKPIYKIILF